ncbi:hypothetical protein [Streptococcus dysgalactiae]|uniref:hypothetical protein n=1 Tax=Streptococcus dysgalactiae TaxID=1334 RepID=UPI001C9D77F0|nr:hypothetical protein [Streptococcus dysgalactiae]MEC4577947.1 hypothetical protein [Streptococcus dysgalactiae]QZT27088.1 hypothetical protein K6973_10325 [Streptococcus dysgalactiae]
MKKLLIKASAVILLTGMGFGTMNHVQARMTGSLRNQAKLRVNNIRDTFKNYTNDTEANYYLRLALSGKKSEVEKTINDYREKCQSRYENDEIVSNY